MASKESIDQFRAISGASEEKAKMWLEMSGGDVSIAMGLFFGDGTATTPVAPASSALPPWFDVVWGSKLETGEVPVSWSDQGFEFCGDKESRFGIVQRKNGPCGVLAICQGMIVSGRLSSAAGSSPAPPSPAIVETSEGTKSLDNERSGSSVNLPITETPVSDTELAKILATIIASCASDGKALCLVSWKDPKKRRRSEIVEHTAASYEDLRKRVEANIEFFRGPGGVLLLVYSAVKTRGVEQVRRDFKDTPAPLIGGRFGLCSFELMSLLMRGIANGDIGAFSQVTRMPHDWGTATNGGMGMLSADFEKRVGMQLCNSLKYPEKPVWIVHGGDHFTVLFAHPLSIKDATSESTKSKKLLLLHWNGLPPGGPRLTLLEVKAPHGPAPPTKGSHTPTFYKPVPGQIDTVVQADKDDKKKRPDEWHTWRYEVVLAVDDPTVDGAPRPKDLPLPKTFSQGTLPEPSKPWRCAKCFATRFKTMCFGQNDAGAKNCRHCSRKIEDCGWAIWLGYGDLPLGWQASMTKRHAPKAITLIQSKWPSAAVGVLSKSKGLPVV